MKSKVIVIKNNDLQIGKIFKTEPYESVRAVCGLYHQTFSPNKIVKTKKGYDYQMRNGNIIYSEQIA